MATFFAHRIEQSAATVQGEADLRVKQVSEAFAMALGRRPDAAELRASTKLVEEHGLRALCHALLNCNEFVYID